MAAVAAAAAASASVGPEVVGKVLYIVVVDEGGEEAKKDNGRDSFRYTRPVLQSTLQLMGCKPRHAFKISQRIFELIRSESSPEPAVKGASESDVPKGSSENEEHKEISSKLEVDDLLLEKANKTKKKPFELYKIRTTVIVKREAFLDVVCDAMAEYKYVGPNQRADLVLACRIRERKESVTVLLCGTSGCGKSTLSALLGSRLGITTVISTDSIRHMMRSFVDEKQNPLLWASTYHAGEYLDPKAVSEAKAKKKAKKLAGVSSNNIKDESFGSNGKSGQPSELGSGTSELISSKQMAIEGYKAQSEMVIDSLDRLITAWEERKESVVVEGVHLSLNFVRKGSSRHLMALCNTDGSVAKAWPVERSSNGKHMNGHGNEKEIGNPMYGPLQISKAEPVNLQFGHFGISAWPSDGGTSHAGSVDESRADGTDTGSRYYSSCCSSPRMSDKELKEDQSVHGSDEEVDDQPELDSDEDLSDDDGDKHAHDEIGSVDEESTKTDEEYDDLAMADIQDHGYWTDDEEESDKLTPVSGDISTRGENHGRNLDRFLRTRSERFSEPLCSYSSLLMEKTERKGSGGNVKARRRSLSIPALGKHGSAISDPILSGAP
ncbi:hypothetical protein ACFE04_014786 [Oxalis oulophora]